MKKRLLFALVLMGLSSLIIQVLLIREFLLCFYGNELTIGLVLGNWIILEAIGSGIFSRMGQRNKKPLAWYALLQCLIALYFPLSIYLIRTVKNILPLTPGESLSPLLVVASSFFILAPLSILDGAQFPFGCRLWKDYSKKPLESAGTVYILEAIGFIVAGPIFTFVFLAYLHSFHSAFIISCLNCLSAFLLIQKEAASLRKKTIRVLSAGLLCAGLFSLLSGSSDYYNTLSLERYWKNTRLVASQNSVYGNIAVTKEQEQFTFYGDGVPLFSVPDPDVAANEELIHFGLLSHPRPRDILIIGGGAGGPLTEILKYPVRSVDYAELDPLLIEMIRRYAPAPFRQELLDRRVSIQIADGARYLSSTKKRYDCIFVNLPIPTSLQINRFYTSDFFSLVKSRLKDTSALFVFKLPGSLTYLNDELKELNLSILTTLATVFTAVKVIPGDENLFLASAGDIKFSPELFAQRLTTGAIQTKLLTPDYLRYRLSDNWQQWFWANLKTSPPTHSNSTLLPRGLFYALAYWNSLFSPRLNLFFTALQRLDMSRLLTGIAILTSFFLIGVICLQQLKNVPVQCTIMSTGLFGMAFDLIIIFIYQSLYGYVYHHIALLITSFMAGLTLGGWFMTKNLSRITARKQILILTEAGIIVFCLLMIPVFVLLKEAPSYCSFIFFVLSLLSGIFVGVQFPLANSLFQQKNSTQNAGRLYALDLLGSWIGALVVAVGLLPVLGLIQTCIILAALKTASLLLLIAGKKL